MTEKCLDIRANVNLFLLSLRRSRLISRPYVPRFNMRREEGGESGGSYGGRDDRERWVGEGPEGSHDRMTVKSTEAQGE
jgi:hypothetical protein